MDQNQHENHSHHSHHGHYSHHKHHSKHKSHNAKKKISFSMRKAELVLSLIALVMSITAMTEDLMAEYL